MSLEITGEITQFLDVQNGISKDGKEWSKQSFLVETKEQYNNLYCFEVFGKEKVEALTKYNKVGNIVKVTFNVNTNEWKGKYFTSLQVFRIDKAEIQQQNFDVPNFETIPQSELSQDTDDDLPF